MKLSKKIRSTYMVALLLGIVVNSIFFIASIVNCRNNEELRMEGISNSLRYDLHEKVENLKTTSNIYKYLISRKTSGSDAYSLFEESKIPSITKNINYYNVIVNVQTNEVTNIYKEEIDYTKDNGILYDIISYIANSNKNEECGFYFKDSKVYLISYVKLEREYDYLLLMKKIDEEYLKKLGANNSNTYIQEGISKDILNNSIVSGNIKYYFSQKGNKIYSYSKIDVVNGKENLYLVIEQEARIQKGQMGYHLLTLMVVLLLSVLVNFLVYLFINKEIIKRILFINESVHKIYDKGDIGAIEIDGRKDEITDLAISINNMVERLDSAKDEVKEGEERFEKIVNSMGNAFIYCKKIQTKDWLDGKIVQANNAARKILKLNEVREYTLSSLFKRNGYFESVLQKKVQEISVNNCVELEKDYEFENNKWGSLTLTSIEEGYFYIIINDITKIKLFSEKMKYLADYDSLTSIYNRRNLLTYVEKLKKENKPFNIFYIDLDNFKGLNDTYGHEKGDYLLKKVSENLLSIANKEIKVGRLGGDEFLLVYEGEYDKKELYVFGNYILKAISKEYVFEDFTYNLKASIGVASFPRDGENVNRVIVSADKAMYESKNNGGNRTTIYKRS